MTQIQSAAYHSHVVASRRPRRVTPLALGFLFVALLACNASAATGDVAFGIRPSYNNVPDLANPGAFDPDVVVYSLPASGSIYAGPTQSFFDVFARVDGGGSRPVQGYGSIIVLGGTGQVTFALPPSPPSGAPNNVPISKNPDFMQNTGLDDSMLGDVNVPGQPGGRRSVGVVGLHIVQNVDVPVFNNDGLFAMPIEVAAGFQGVIGLSVLDNEYVGFAQNDGTIVTNTSRFPHQGAIVEVRAAVRGDFNGDLIVDAQDWTGFNAARADLAAFQAEYPWLPAVYAGDFNEDGAINVLDVPAFQQLAGVPEPSTFALMLAAAAPLVLVRCRAFRRR